MTEPLKPCPFCGDKDPAYYPGVELWPCVKCQNCGCETGHDEVAVERWQARAIDTEAIRKVAEEIDHSGSGFLTNYINWAAALRKAIGDAK